MIGFGGWRWGVEVPSAITASCCFTRTSSGTSSDLVHPPSGDSHNTGLVKPFFNRISRD